MTKRARRYLWGMLTGFLVPMLVALLLTPPDQMATLQHIGFCFFGSMTQTAPLFWVPMFVEIVMVTALVRLLLRQRGNLRLIGWGMLATEVLLVGLFVTPYYISGLVHTVHDDIAAVLFAAEFGLGTWVLVTARFDRSALALWLVSLAGDLLAGLSFINWIGDLMFVGQVVAQVGFLGLLIRALDVLEARGKYLFVGTTKLRQLWR